MKKFDKEYSTQFVAERDYLREHGIQPTFIKIVNEVTTFKYEKNEKLFEELLNFYKNK